VGREEEVRNAWAEAPSLERRDGSPKPLALVLSLGCALVAFTTPVFAQEEGAPPESADGFSESAAQTRDSDARALAEKAKIQFQLGNEAYERGNYRKAAEAFEQAHRFSPHSAVLFNAARAWWKMGESERAADDYAEAIRRGELTSEQALRARSALASLRKKLGWIIVSGPPDTRVSVDHRAPTSLPLTTHLAPGDHVLYLEQDGDRWQQLVHIAADAPLSVVAQKSLVSEGTRDLDEPPPPLPEEGGNAQKTWGWLTLGVGTALGAGAVVTGLFTLNARSEFDGLNDGTLENVAAAQARRNEAVTWRTVTNVLAISGGAVALTGFTLLLTAPRKPSARYSVRTLSVSVLPTQVELAGAF
jgi:tetratricopeptide (TPR) repeat protein